MRVYFAGKISGNDWRAGIWPTLSWRWRGTPNAPTIERLPDGRLTLISPPAPLGSIEYGGPFFVQHFDSAAGLSRKGYPPQPSPEETHGVLALPKTGYVSEEENGGHGAYHWQSRAEDSGDGLANVRPFEIVRMCRDLIERADWIFVWIDSEDVYGTLIEIGYAAALGKPIFLAYSYEVESETHNGLGGMWFLEHLVATRRPAINAVQGFRWFVEYLGLPETWGYVFEQGTSVPMSVAWPREHRTEEEQPPIGPVAMPCSVLIREAERLGLTEVIEERKTLNGSSTSINEWSVPGS